MANVAASLSVQHVRFDLSGSTEDGAWFALFPVAAAAMPGKALFSGPIGPDMAAELRGLADAIDGLLDQIGGGDV